MAVPADVPSREVTLGNGITDLFPTSFLFFEEDTLRVTLEDANGVLTEKELNVDYAVTGGRSGPGNPQSGTVQTTSFVPQTGEKIVIERIEPLTQQTSYTRGGAVPGQNIEQSDDRLTFQNQQQDDRFRLGVEAPISRDPSLPVLTIPIPEDGKALIGLPDLSGWTSGEVAQAGEVVLPLSISQGGTGGTTQGQAQSNLGLAIGTDVNEFMATVIKSEAEQGTSNTRRAWTANRVAQAIAFQAASSTDVRLAFLQLAELQGELVAMRDGFADSFEDEASINTGVSKGNLFVSSGGYIENSDTILAASTVGTGSNTTQMDGTVRYAGLGFSTPSDEIKPRRAIVEVTSVGGSPDRFVGRVFEQGVTPARGGTDDIPVTVAAVYEGAFPNPFTLEISKDWVLEFQQLSVWTAQLATVGRPGPDTSFTTLLTTSVFNETTHSNVDAGEDLRLGLVSTSDLVLQNLPYAADYVPTTARILVQVLLEETFTVNTDLIAEVSRDGGVTFTQAVLAGGSSLGAGTVFYEDVEVDLSGQPSAQEMVYRITTPTRKRLQVHGVVLQWT